MAGSRRCVALAACLLIAAWHPCEAASQGQSRALLADLQPHEFEVDVGIYDSQPAGQAAAAPSANPQQAVIQPSAPVPVTNTQPDGQTPIKDSDLVVAKVPEQVFAGEQQALGIVPSATPAAAPAQVPVKPLTACEVILALQVCSHRANVSEVATYAGQHVGLLQRLAVLESNGLVCHDLDVFQTQDGALRVGHPAELKAFRFGSHLIVGDPLSQDNPADSGASVEVGKPGAAPAAAHSHLDMYFPLLDDLLDAFNGLTGTTHDTQVSRGEPHLFIELKGRALQEANLKHLAEKAKQLELEDSLAVWVAHARGQAVLESVRGAGLKLDAIKSFPDRIYAAGMKLSQDGWQEGPGSEAHRSRALLQEQHQHSLIMHQLQPRDAELYQFLGPSIRAKPAELFTSIRATGRPLVLWTVDTPGQLAAAVQMGASRVISNQPLAMKKLMEDWSATCKATGNVNLPTPLPTDLS